MTGKSRKLTPHPHALLLPALTDDEYRALKSDIKQHGILYPIIVDENRQILDGVHRVRIATELDIDLPITRHTNLTEDRKLHLAVGLNMRRRHLDADRRRELVRKLHKANRLSLRRIADITGWSKSTVERDLKTSPYEAIIASAADSLAEQQAAIAEIDDATAQRVGRVFISGQGEMLNVFQYADSQWKRGNWPLPLIEQAQMDLVLSNIADLFGFMIKMLDVKTTKSERQRLHDEHKQISQERKRDWRRLERIATDPVKLQRWAEQYEREHGIRKTLRLDTAAVPNGTPTVTPTPATTGVCDYCGREFQRERSTKRYCSDAHRQMAYRARKRQ